MHYAPTPNINAFYKEFGDLVDSLVLQLTILNVLIARHSEIIPLLDEEIHVVNLFRFWQGASKQSRPFELR